MFEENPAGQGMGWDEKSKSDHGASGIKNGLSTESGGRVGITSRIKSGFLLPGQSGVAFCGLNRHRLLELTGGITNDV